MGLTTEERNAVTYTNELGELVVTDFMVNSLRNRTFCGEILTLISRDKNRQPRIESTGRMIRVVDKSTPIIFNSRYGDRRIVRFESL